MPRIYIDARNITGRPAGVSRYVRSLLRALIDEAKPEYEFVAIRHRTDSTPIVSPAPKQLVEIPVAQSIDGLQNHLFGHRTLEATFARGGPPDLFHSPFHVVPRRLRSVLGDTPVVTTVHDFVWLDDPEACQPTFWRARAVEAFGHLAIPDALRTADRVIAVSDCTRRRARQYVDDSSMVTISHGVDDAFFEPAEPPTGEFSEFVDPQRPYIVAVGNDKSYKNLGLLIDAFQRLIDEGVSTRLVLIGDCKGLAATISPDAAEWIAMPGLVDDDRLRRLLGHARVFALPSRIEGFGLPLLEAMAMGVPSVISDVEPLRSIGDEATLYFDPDDPALLARLLDRILDDDALADRMSRRGRRRAAEFRWSDTARQTLEVYASLITAEV